MKYYIAIQENEGEDYLLIDEFVTNDPSEAMRQARQYEGYADVRAVSETYAKKHGLQFKEDFEREKASEWFYQQMP